MSETSKQPVNKADLSKKIEFLLDLTTISYASTFAQTGKYAEAESLLLPLMESSENKQIATDLLAKIAAQKGNYHQAIILWEQALTGDPQNKNFQKAIEDCRLQQKGNQNRGKWNLTANIIIGINVAIVIGLLLVVTILLNVK